MNAGILTRKIGPLPAWAWGGLAAVAVWYFFLRGKTGTSTGATATPGPDATYGLGFAQGQQAAQAQQPAAATAAANKTITVGNSNGQGVPIWSYDVNHQGVIGTTKDNTDLPVIGPAAGFHSGEPGYLVQWQGGTGWVSGANVVGQSAGVGGPSRGRSIGSRAAAPLWSDAHPLVGGNVRYAHYVRAVGGASGHRAEVQRVARQAGIHPARVLMLNPVPTGRIRVA